MKKPLIRIISLILAVLSLAFAFPLSVFAKEEKADEAESTAYGGIGKFTSSYTETVIDRAFGR